MKALFVVTSFVAAVSCAHAAKSCEELKTEIAAKLDAKGVKGYSLTVVENADVGDAKVVGHCDGGTRKITYKR